MIDSSTGGRLGFWAGFDATIRERVGVKSAAEERVFDMQGRAGEEAGLGLPTVRMFIPE